MNIKYLLDTLILDKCIHIIIFKEYKMYTCLGLSYLQISEILGSCKNGYPSLPRQGSTDKTHGGLFLHSRLKDVLGLRPIETFVHGNLRVPPIQCHVSPKEINRLIK